MAKFSDRICALRKEKKMTQQKMADFCGIQLRSYQAYEYATRTPDFRGLIAIADFFDVSLDYLVGRSDVRERR